MFNFLLDRLKEKTTWFGITAVMTAGGLTIAPEMQNQLIAAGTGVAGLIGMFTKDAK